jgi:hypothetical protein
MGATGAALAMCLGFVVQAVLRFLEMRHVFGWSWPWHSLRRPVAAFVVAMLPALAIRMAGGLVAELASGIVFLLAYAGCWFWLGAEPADREIWRQLRGARQAQAAVAAPAVVGAAPVMSRAVSAAGSDGV